MIFLPWTHGGLKVLDPVIQHTILQKRWLNYIFDSAIHPSFVYMFVLNHLSLFSKSAHGPLVPFYFPEYCKSRTCDTSLSIWHAIFRAFDIIQNNESISLRELPLATLLDLPLYKALIPPDNNHWTLKHKTFLCGQFFIFDVNRNRLRLRVAGEYARYPRLCQQLYNDILITRTVRLQSSIWPYILEERPSIVEWSGHSMVTNITSSSVWKQYSSQNVREGIQSPSPLLVKHPAFVVKAFWTCLMYPNARTLYFRSLSNCLPTKKVLLKYGVVLSSTCSLCGVHTDTTRHFLVECDIKWKLWKLDLQHYFLWYVVQINLQTTTSSKLSWC